MGMRALKSQHPNDRLVRGSDDRTEAIRPLSVDAGGRLRWVRDFPCLVTVSSCPHDRRLLTLLDRAITRAMATQGFLRPIEAPTGVERALSALGDP
jgi:hypothetical protein